MSLWRNLKIRKKIIGSIVIILLLLTGILSICSITSIRSLGMSDLKEKGGSLAIITAETVKAAVQYGIREDAEKVLDQLISSDSDVSIVAVAIQAPKGDIAVFTQKKSKLYGNLDITPQLKSLVSHAPSKKGETILLSGGNLQYVAVKIDLTANDVIQNAYLLLAVNNTRLSSGLNASTVTMLGLGLLALLLGTLCAIFVSNSITNPLKDAVLVANALAEGDLRIDVVVKSKDETGQMMEAMKHMVQNLRTLISHTVTVSTSIVSATDHLHTTSTRIAVRMEEAGRQVNTVATASEEMAATSNDIAHNCTVVAESSRLTAASATAGSAVVNETISGMDLIAERVKLTSKTIEALGVRSEQIGDIIRTIEDIADQTNLLALNAAIEAARAGEQGRGFAVVADEVRVLADRTTKATKDISVMIKGIQKDTKEAVFVMGEGVHEVEKDVTCSHKSGQVLEEILQRIKDVGTQINQIATAAEEQTATTNEVTKNIQQITDVVLETAHGAEETVNEAKQLSEQAKSLLTLVSRFRLS